MWQYCRTPGAAGCSVGAIVKSELSLPVFPQDIIRGHVAKGFVIATVVVVVHEA